MLPRIILTALMGVSTPIFAAAPVNTDVRSFDTAPVFANAATMLRRLGHGLQFRQTVLEAEKNGIDLTGFTVDPRSERWKLVLPGDGADDTRNGVLVWLASDDEGDIPAAILRAASSRGLGVITALRAGEEQALIERRAALALIGAYGYGKVRSLDPTKILIGGAGLSGEHALLLAVGYPDIFSGAIAIDAPISLGTQQLPVPLPQLMSILRQRSDIAFLTTNDEMKSKADDASRSFGGLCVPGTKVYPASSEIPEQVLHAVMKDIEESANFPTDSECLSLTSDVIKKDLATLVSLVEDNQWSDAGDMLLDIHFRYGGLAETEVVKNWDLIVAEHQNLSLQAAERFVKSAGNLRRMIAPKPLPHPRQGM